MCISASQSVCSLGSLGGSLIYHACMHSCILMHMSAVWFVSYSVVSDDGCLATV